MSDSFHKIVESLTGADFAASLEQGTDRKIPWNVPAEYNYPPSAGNSTVQQLAAGATFQGTVESTARQPSLQIAVYSDQPYTVHIVQFSDSSGARETGRVTYTRAANTGVNESVSLNDWFYRVIVINNSTSPTLLFSLSCSQGYTVPGPKAPGNYGGFPVEIVGRGEELKSYFVAAFLAPTTLTTQLNFFALRNSSTTRKIKLQKLEILQYFTGTAAATGSAYAIRKFTGCTGFGGTTTTPAAEAVNSASAASVTDMRASATGLTLTNASAINPNRFLFSFGCPNQVNVAVPYDRDFETSPIVLGPNEGIALLSNGAIVLGSTIHLGLRWVEEDI